MKPSAFTGKYMFSRSHTGVKFVPFSWSQHKNLTSVGSLKQAWRPRQLLCLSQIPPSPNCCPCGPAPPAGGPVPDPEGAITQICWTGGGWNWLNNMKEIMQFDNMLWHFWTNRPVYLWHICANFVLKCYLYQSSFSIHAIYVTQLHELRWQFHGCQ